MTPSGYCSVHDDTTCTSTGFSRGGSDTTITYDTDKRCSCENYKCYCEANTKHEQLNEDIAYERAMQIDLRLDLRLGHDNAAKVKARCMMLYKAVPIFNRKLMPSYSGIQIIT